MRLFKRVLSLFLVISVIFSLCSILSFAESNTQLRFGADGKFKIVVFADCQDDADPNDKMIEMIENALDVEKPDLVAFTGDNVVVTIESSFRTGAQKIIQPLIDRNIPYVYTFGNHDDEYGMSKETMHNVYMSLGTCLTYDADPSLNGFGNCNVPIYSSTGNDIAFNLWMIDSLAYEVGITEYDHVREDQLAWYKKTSLELEEQAGHKVNSIMFQHIALPEIYNLLVEDSGGSKTYQGKTYRQELNENASGYLGEFPCPPRTNGGQFDALLERGDVLGVVTGHDHSNGFHGKYKGIGFLQMPGMSFQSYGDDNCRGYGVIEIDERDTSTYSTYIVPYIDFWNGSRAVSTWNRTDYYCAPSNGLYISEIKFSSNAVASTAKKGITDSGFTLIDSDLNKGAGGQYVYMGYKTTNDISKAIRDVRFYAAKDDASRSSVTATVNGSSCVYNRVSTVDLNKGASGHYIFGYVSYDPNAGLPVTDVGLSNAVTDNSCCLLSMPSVAADLNMKAGGDFIYCNLSRINPLNVDTLFEKVEFVERLLADNVFAKESDKTLRTALANAQSAVTDLKDDGFTDRNQNALDTLVSELERGVSLLTFEVRFVNYDGSLIETSYVTYGFSALCSKIPVKPSDEQYNYTFKGWDKDISAVYSTLTATALYDFEHYHTSSAPVSCLTDEVCKFCGEVMNEATGHGDGVLKNVLDVTCDKDGYTGDFCCSLCDTVLTPGEALKATGHVWSDWVYYTLPTVTAAGKDRSTCSVCKTTIYRDTDKATTATVENEFIFGFKSNLAPNQVNGYFDERYLSVTKTAYNGKVMGTNSVISVLQKNVTTNYTVVIFGDVNGDGWYDGQDAVIVSCLANGMLTAEDVTPAEYKAADCNHDGAVDALDVELLNTAGSLLTDVDQSKSDAELQTNAFYTEYLNIIEQSPELQIEEAPDEPIEARPQLSIFDMILAYIKSFIELIISYIPSYI